MHDTIIHNDEGLNQFEAIFEYASMGILITDDSGKITAINPFALKEFGYTAKELIGKKIEALIPYRFHKNHVQYRENYSKDPKGRAMGMGMDLFALKKDGAEIPVEISLASYFTKGDKFVIAFITNISVRKNASVKFEEVNNDLEEKVKERTEILTRIVARLEEQQKETKDAEEEIKNVQELFLQLMRNYPDGAISIIDKGYHFLYTGGELHTRLDTEAKQLIGREIYPDFPEPLRQAIQIKLSDVFKNKSVISQYELPDQLGGNTYVMDAFPLVEDDGSVNKAGVIIRNISALKKIEKDLRTALQKEKELNELKSRFVSMASHEFRTPLSTVLSSAYLLEKYTTTDDQPKRLKHLERIVSSVTMLTDILNDFLSVGKIEEGKIQVRPTSFNIRDFIIAIAGEMKNSLKQQQKITCYHEGNPEVFMDTSLLKHIIMNLVSNASKFSPEGMRIEISTIAREDQVTLSVKDHGIGISKQDQKHLMERFFRGANVGNIQGTGLGLHLVSKYTGLLNGTVECISELEKGTEFLITINTKNKLL